MRTESSLAVCALLPRRLMLAGGGVSGCREGPARPGAGRLRWVEASAASVPGALREVRELDGTPAAE
jgi:hypothetical protein